MYVAEWLIEPSVAWTAMAYGPLGVVGDVVRVIVLVHVGTQLDGAKDAVVSGGSPVALKETAFAVPDVRVAVTPSVIELPGKTLPEEGLTDKAKSNPGGAGGVSPGIGIAVALHVQRSCPTWIWA